MSLRDVDLRIGYRTDEQNIVDNFYIPCLSASAEYCRAVGYFSSSALVVTAKGLFALIQNGGAMRLIASPRLMPEDVEAIRRGHVARHDVIQQALIRSFDKRLLLDPTAIEAHRLQCLAWLISEHRLEVKIAVPSNPESPQALYHEKIGLFSDKQGHTVAFTGSPNESANALLSNFESIDVYWSWDDPHGRVDRKTQQFQRMWCDETPGLEVMPFPTAVQNIIASFKKNSVIPKPDPESATSSEDSKETRVQLRPYQHEAVRAWMSQNYCGLLAMATGAGKTITALAAIHAWLKHAGRGVILITCPYQHLVDQWTGEVMRFGYHPVVAYRASQTWSKQLARALLDYQFGARSNIVVVTTHATLARSAMQAFIEKIKGPFLMVADEAHHLGADDLRKKLPMRSTARLGLSATPERWMDDAGSRAIESFFGPIAFEYSLNQAIADGHLTPYQYYPHLVQLTEDEQETYSSISRKIARMWHNSNESDHDERLQALLRERVAILNTAKKKIETLRWLVSPTAPFMKHALFYCAPGQIDEVISLLGHDLGMLVHPFTAQESASQRQKILSSFARGELQALVAMRCLDEGVDVPSTRTAFVLASSSNPREFIQRRGRLLRRAPGKDLAIIHDLITIPNPYTLDDRSLQHERSLLRRELARFKEFASSAVNFFEANAVVLPIAEQYRLLDF